jgi:methionyl-tRNA synthetase
LPAGAGHDKMTRMTIDEFSKVELKVGTIKEAERVEGSEKLLKLKVDLGEEVPRQILSGIGKHYEPADIIGKQAVFITNLEPRMMMGLESNGMLLAASDPETLALVGVDKNVIPGSLIH